MSSHAPRPPRPPLWLIALASLLVPSPDRERFRRQWDADLVHRWGRLTAQKAPFRRLALLGWAFGAVPHGLHLAARTVRARTGGGLASGFVTDVGQGARALLRRPGLTALAVTILAVGIGSTTALFSVVESALLRPLPFPDQDRLVALWSLAPRFDGHVSLSYPDFRDYRDSGLIESGAVWWAATNDLAGNDEEPERVRMAEVEEGFFDVLGAGALVGRLLARDDYVEGGPRGIVLSEGLWRRRYGGDPSMVGRDVRLDGRTRTVIGVLPDAQAWPPSVQIWAPLPWGRSMPEWVLRRSNHTWNAVARLAAGATPTDARARFAEISRRVEETEPGAEQGWRGDAIPLHESLVDGQARRALLLVGITAAGVLLIACFNVASLLLVGAARRSRDLTLRAALGAGRVRLFRQLLTESLLLALLSGALGTVLGVAGMRLALSRAPAGFERLADGTLNAPVLVFALAASLAAALVAGLAPGLRASRTDVADALREGGTGASAGRRRRRAQRALVVAELALSTTLLLGAGLMVRSVSAALDRDLGFDARGVLTFLVGLPGGRYDDDAARLFYTRALDELAAVPGVSGATLTARVPGGGPGNNLLRVFLPEGAAEPPAGPDHPARWIEVEPGYFETLGVTPLQGRTFTPGDGAGSEPVMIVTERMARSLAPGGSAVGLMVRSWRDENVYRRVVGVVPTIRMEEYGEESFPVVFVPVEQSPRRTMAFMLRTDLPTDVVVPGVREAFRRLDPDLALDRIATMDDVRRQAMAPVRFMTALLSVFGVFALILAGAGVYGLIAASVNARTRELGIRIAMGASVRHVRRLVLAEGAGLAVAGTGLGVLGALAFARAIRSFLTGVSWLDAGAWAAVIATMVAAALVATVVPALRATRVDPARTLRAD